MERELSEIPVATSSKATYLKWKTLPSRTPTTFVVPSSWEEVGSQSTAGLEQHCGLLLRQPHTTPKAEMKPFCAADQSSLLPYLFVFCCRS